VRQNKGGGGGRGKEKLLRRPAGWLSCKKNLNLRIGGGSGSWKLSGTELKTQLFFFFGIALPRYISIITDTQSLFFFLAAAKIGGLSSSRIII
jgi:hypothetical protein